VGLVALLVFGVAVSIPFVMRRRQLIDRPTPVDGSAEPPTAGQVFGEVWWRSMALATLAGGIFGAIVAGVVASPGYAEGADLVVVYVQLLLLGVVFGCVMGLLLGISVGFVLACILAARLIPFRGAPATRLEARAWATLLVAAWLAVFDSVTAWTSSAAGFAFWSGLPIVATWFVAPLATNWYVRRMTPTNQVTTCSSA
jgi:hypothetical protein